MLTSDREKGKLTSVGLLELWFRCHCKRVLWSYLVEDGLEACRRATGRYLRTEKRGRVERNKYWSSSLAGSSTLILL